MVPNIIHQIVGPKKNNVVRRCLSSWTALRGESYKIKIWTDARIEKFLTKYYPQAVLPFLTARNHAEAADLARYLIIYHYGGHYYDWDIQLLSMELFKELCFNHPQGFLLRDPRDQSIASEAFAAEKGEAYLLKLATNIIQIFTNNERDSMSTLIYSGPMRMNIVYAENPNSKQSMLEVKDVFLYDYSEIKEMPESTDSKAMIHYWLHSWL
ncbi:Glycosyltransferase sugar-binding region containing DXD motif-containing protein [Pedobacter steynii]|uniref:Glycosyltransferase sugar-binding region containing DXD motif-containing protein n=1 Tax=Pedobacter steynii TaxID=430522 RepID=A0A1G9K724_9SPHI|nr:glycosyltransferase [Pedobacter steynii]NQX38470.1 hypothetical protein [Pedobacter steynii]SDL45597.1 Glycosyltransferase sugar-binding region containing DXD motif-containing protein [Pedobacter steynii]